jgi:hypothetical protein
MLAWIKNKIDALLNWFGYVKMDLAIIEKELELFKAKYSALMDKPKVDPTRKRIFDENWDDFWKEQYEPYYVGWYLSNLSKYPTIFTNYLIKVSEFDWKEIEDFMKENNWFWSYRDRSPNKEELIVCTLDLLFTCIHKEENIDDKYLESGGFKVAVKNGEVFITFDKTVCHD